MVRQDGNVRGNWVKSKQGWDFPGGAVVKTLQWFHCRGQGFDPWSGN